MYRKILYLILVLFIICTIFPDISIPIARADSYSGGMVTIDTPFTTGSLSTAVTAAHGTLSEITGLTITAGQLNSDDFYWMRDNLPNLQTLEISGVAMLVSDKVPDNAFFNNNTYKGHVNLTSVNISSAISIGKAAFAHCDAITSVSFPEATSTGSHAFYDCDALTSVSFPKAISIGYYAFKYCNTLTSVSFPKVTSIREGGFSNCDALPSVSFPKVTSIEDDAFYDCDALTSVSFPKVTSIGDSAFYDCDALPSVLFPEATSIGELAFYDCNALTSVSFLKATSIGDYAFGNCNKLTSVLFSEATSIGKRAFYDCDALTSVSFPKATSIGERSFYGCNALTSVSFPEATEIGGYSFHDCDSLTSIILPKVTQIDEYAFQNCDLLTNVILPEITSVSYGLFFECNSLENITISKATSIGTCAFRSCESLTSIVLPEVTSIGDDSFTDCTKLGSLTMGSTLPTIGTDAFPNTPSSRTVYVPLGSEEAYKYDITDGDTNDSLWYGFDIATDPDTVCTLSEWTITASNGTSYKNANELNLAYEVKKVTLSAMKDEVRATLSGDIGTQILALGQNVFIITVTAINPLYTKDYPITIHRAQNDEKSIQSIVFESLDPDAIGLVDEVNHTVQVYVPYGTDVTNLVPTINISADATISPTNGVVQDFSNPVIYTVTAQDGTTRDYIVTVKEANSTQNDIQSFTINAFDPVVNGQISASQITMTVPYGTDITALTPTVIISPYATINPESLSTQDFTDPVIYTVTAQNGTTREYIIIVEVEASTNTKLKYLKLDDMSITNFSPSTSSYSVNVPYGKDQVSISVQSDDENAILMGAIGEFALKVGGNNFEISVTAEDGKTKKAYTISVYRAENNDATLQNLEIDGKQIAGFDPFTTSYEMKVEKDIETLKLGYRPTGTDIITYFDYQILPGENICTITVKNNAFEQEYTIVIIKDEDIALAPETESDSIQEKQPDQTSIQETPDATPQDVGENTGQKKNISALEIILIICGAFILITSIIWFLIWWTKRKKL